jgi:hypothetical protein
MKKFLVLYRSSVSAKDQMASATPEQGKAGMDAWMAWAKKAGPAVIDLGSPCGDSSLLRGSPAAGFIGGYSLVQGETVDQVKRLFEGHPHFQAPNGSIELLELMSIPGM